MISVLFVEGSIEARVSAGEVVDAVLNDAASSAD
jgi:hypothetical protein